jgi:L-fuconolactonase
MDAFGPTRLMCGSDWPVLLLNGDYDRVWEATLQIVEEVAGADASALLGENAADVYGFAETRGTARAAGKDAWPPR